MKIRNNYVSNSSSSSFILAIDKAFFGDLEDFFTSHQFGFETAMTDADCILEYWGDEKEIKEKIKRSIDNGKDIFCISIDSEYEDVIDLLEHINQANGGDKMEIIYDGRN